MAKDYDTESFTGNIVAVVIGVIVVGAVAVPIITGLVGPANSDAPIKEGTTTATIVMVIPIFLVLAILMAVVYMFLQKKNGGGDF